MLLMPAGFFVSAFSGTSVAKNEIWFQPQGRTVTPVAQSFGCGGRPGWVSSVFNPWLRFGFGRLQQVFSGHFRR
jgi:hypothetical protein